MNAPANSDVINTVLEALTITGSVLSMIGLVLTILTMLIFK